MAPINSLGVDVRKNVMSDNTGINNDVATTSNNNVNAAIKEEEIQRMKDKIEKLINENNALCDRCSKTINNMREAEDSKVGYNIPYMRLLYHNTNYKHKHHV